MSDPNRVIPFMRNSDVNPAIVPIAIAPAAYQIPGGAAGLNAAGVTAFTATNPNPFAIWLRGWSGSMTPVPDPTDKGNYIPPGAQITQSSVRPDYLVATPDTKSLLWPYYGADGTTPLYDMSKARLVIVFGSGL